MISVAEQFSTLRSTLGSLLGIFTLLRWLRTLLARLTGRPPPADATALTPASFARFTGAHPPLPDGSPAPPRPSKKPFLVFLLAAFGLPYLMGKLIRALARTQEAALAARGHLALGPDGRPLPPDQQGQLQLQLQQDQGQGQVLDPTQLDFCRVLYDFSPDAAATGGPLTPGVDLAVAAGDLVAVLGKSDPVGQPSEWWRCRARDGRVGYLPSPYLEVIQRRPREIGMSGEGGMSGVGGMSGGGTRAQTMTTGTGTGTGMGMGEGGSRAGSLKGGVGGLGKVGDISAESFQRGTFYS